VSCWQHHHVRRRGEETIDDVKDEFWGQPCSMHVDHVALGTKADDATGMSEHLAPST
jgi:hypothetical protein